MVEIPSGLFTDKNQLAEAIELAKDHKRRLHEMPEMAFNEHRTTEYIREVCSAYPLSLIDLGMDTGLVYLLDAGRDEAVALRADIDAVPTANGPLHLCGHDAHSSTLIGAIHYLCAVKDSLTCNVVFIFQPAEEGTRGAKAVLEHGLLDKLPQRPSCIFGIHNRPEEDCGNIVVHRGPLMSEKSVFRITINGKPGHGSLPHKCVDPVVAAASIICGIQTIISRNIDPFEPAICTVNSIKAGDSESSAPENAYITGYIRSFDHKTHEHMADRLTELAMDISKAYQCRCRVSITHMVPAVDNTQEMYEKAMKAARAVASEKHIIDCRAVLASEDFAVYGEHIPSFLYWVGSGIPGKQCASWHDPAFEMDTRYMETAVPLMCASVLTH